MNNFRGWKHVFGFTFKQTTKSLPFRIVTSIITIILLAALIVTNVLIAKPKKGEKIEPSQINTIYVVNQTGFAAMDLKTLSPAFQTEVFQHIQFANLDPMSREDFINYLEVANEKTLGLYITSVEDAFEMELIIVEKAQISVSEANRLIVPLEEAFNNYKLLQSGLTDTQLGAITKPIVTDFTTIGETRDEISMVIQMLAPMFFSLVLYMMLILHGQNVSKSVATEKTSKLMETLLTTVHPYAMMLGKVLAIVSIAILQLITWVLAIVVGLYGGNVIAKAIYPSYNNSVIQILDFIREHLGEGALSLPTIIMAIIFLCVGFLFYCVLAAFAGAMVSKPEDVSTTQALFQTPIMISWLFAYLAPLFAGETVLKIIRYIPLTAPFVVPADLMTGSMAIWEGIISLFILLIFSILSIMFAAKLYKGLVLYTGQRVNFKTIKGIIKNK